MLDDVLGVARTLALASAGQVLFFTVFGGGFMVNLIYNCGNLISDGVLSLGDTSALAMYLLITGKGVQGVVSANADLQKALGAFERVLNLSKGEAETGHAPENTNGTSVTRPLLFTGGGPSVEFVNVDFGYGGKTGTKILTDMNFYVPGESKTAIIGPSGSAKSTIFSLITRLYEKDGGRILIDNRAIEEYNIEDLRRSIGVVPQETWLFGGSLMQNVAYPEKTTDVEGVKEMAALHFVKDWEKSAGEKGQALSGGERQRICIARALVKDPALVLLDEFNSALDRETDATILKQLGLLKRKTVMAITHKVNIVDWADRLIVVDQGRVVQEGDRDKLLRNPGDTLKRLLKDIEKS